MSLDSIAAAIDARDLVSLYELRIDLVGPAWRDAVRELPRPWIACNRIPSEGGRAVEPEAERIGVLREAVALGASIIDIELMSDGLASVMSWAKGRVEVLVSCHDTEGTPAVQTLDDIVRRQRAAGADISKVVTTACVPGDNVTMLQLVSRHRDLGVVSFAMGPLGMASRVLAPLAGARFTYASLAAGSESAPGQLTVGDLSAMYRALGVLS
jgi:3-dehydroquinate dehydratase-1